jgi:hypothetical protein
LGQDPRRIPPQGVKNVDNKENIMTARIGNKDQAQHRSKQEKLETRRANKEREAARQAVARAKYRNQVRGQAPLDLSGSAA